MTSMTLEQTFFESILQEIEKDKIDALPLLRLQTECSQIRTFSDFCYTLAIEKWTEPIRVEMLQWQKALGLSSEKFYRVMNLPLTRLMTALKAQDLSRILDAAEAVKAMPPDGFSG